MLCACCIHLARVWCCELGLCSIIFEAILESFLFLGACFSSVSGVGCLGFAGLLAWVSRNNVLMEWKFSDLVVISWLMFNNTCWDSV